MQTLLATPVLTRRGLAVVAGLLFIYGAKCWLIAKYGSDTPFWDQWSAEGEAVFKRHLDGTLEFLPLFDHHNEHRIFFTRILGLALLQANGHWSPILQMIVNAAIHVAATGTFILAIRNLLVAGSLWAFMIFAAIVLSIPFGWENTLTGFQLQFYLLIALSIASLLLLYDTPAFSPRWWGGVAIGVASYFAMASAALTFLAVIGLALAQQIAGHRRDPREWSTLACLAAIPVLMILDIPKLSTEPFSVGAFFAAVVKAASWPLAARHWRTGLEAVGALFLHAPLIALAVRLLLHPPPAQDRRWFLLMVGIWVLLQIAALAHGRANGIMAPRYLDVFLMGLLVNCACVLVFWHQCAGTSAGDTLARSAAAFWILAVLYGGAQRAETNIPLELANRERTEKLQTENLKKFLESGDASHLRDKPLFHIPYPSAEALASIASDPGVRSILPPHLLGKPETAPLRDFVLRRGPLLMPIGLGLLIISLLPGRRRETGPD